MPASGESDHAKVICELRREKVVDMRRVAESVKKQQRVALPAPIQIVQAHSIHVDELSFMWRSVRPSRIGQECAHFPKNVILSVDEAGVVCVCEHDEASVWKFSAKAFCFPPFD